MNLIPFETLLHRARRGDVVFANAADKRDALLTGNAIFVREARANQLINHSRLPANQPKVTVGFAGGGSLTLQWGSAREQRS